MLKGKMASLKDKLFSEKVSEVEKEKILEELEVSEEETPTKVEKKNKRK